MKRFIIAGAMVIALAGCGAVDNSGMPEFSPTSAATITDKDRVFVETVRDNTDLTGEDADFVNFGKEICLSFDNGMDFEGVAGVIIDSGISEWDAGYVIGASVGAYCPRHSDQFKEDSY